MHSIPCTRLANMPLKKRKTQQFISPSFTMPKKLSGLAVLLIVLGVVAFFWWGSLLTPVSPDDQNKIEFVVAPGTGLKAIATNLKKAHLIKNSLAFMLMAKQTGLDHKIQAGDFQLSPSQSARQIAESLTRGTED